jgi:hypothetical protein
MDESRNAYGEPLEIVSLDVMRKFAADLNRRTMDPTPDIRDVIPDVRDGLTRKERIVLYVLDQARRELGGRNVPTAMLWGRVCEYFYIAPEALSEMLARLGARK